MRVAWTWLVLAWVAWIWVWVTWVYKTWDVGNMGGVGVQV